MSDADAVVAVRVDSARQAIGLLRRGHGQGLTMLTAGEVTIDADAAQIPVGIDGETVLLPAPVRCVIQPRALRVIVPRERPGVPAPKPALEWPRQLASFRTRPQAVPVPASQARSQARKPGRTPWLGRPLPGDPTARSSASSLWHQSGDHLEPRSLATP
jgi:hypothetical protein